MINYSDLSLLPCPTLMDLLIFSFIPMLILSRKPSDELIHLAQNLKMSFLILKSFLCADVIEQMFFGTNVCVFVHSSLWIDGRKRRQKARYRAFPSNKTDWLCFSRVLCWALKLMSGSFIHWNRFVWRTKEALSENLFLGVVLSFLCLRACWTEREASIDDF